MNLYIGIDLGTSAAKLLLMDGSGQIHNTVNLARKQIYIPATQPEEIVLRVAAYCRVSTDSDDQTNSFAAQNTHYNNLIKSHDRWELVDIYADEGITGTSAKKRGDFQRMLEDCRKGKIDKILVKSISRFARNTKDCLEAVRELRTLGISIFFEEHNIDTRMVSSEMLTSVIAACAQAESESISQNMKWSIQKKMQNGTYVASSVPFGFRRVNGNLVIEEAEARYVRSAFSNYLAGKSTSDIAKEFTTQSAADPALGSRKWSFQAIVEMLKNEKYIGDAMYQKTYMTDSLPRQCLRNRGERDRYYATDTHPGIIDRQSYDAVQHLLRQRSEKHVRHTVNTSPLDGRFICGKCGAGFRRKQNKGNAVFSCMSHVQHLSSCDMPPIPEDAVIQAFLRLYDNLKHGEILQFIQKTLSTIRSRKMLWSTDIVELNQRISDISSQSHKLSTLNRRGMVDPDIFISKSNQLAEQLRNAKQQKERILQQEDRSILDSTEQLLETIEAGPEVLEAFDEELFCELIDKIIVESNVKIRFRLKNGLELPETIERTVR